MALACLDEASVINFEQVKRFDFQLEEEFRDATAISVFMTFLSKKPSRRIYLKSTRIGTWWYLMDLEADWSKAVLISYCERVLNVDHNRDKLSGPECNKISLGPRNHSNCTCGAVTDIQSPVGIHDKLRR